jgi:hypothetical protein
MSLVDRWLALPFPSAEAATSATSPKKASISVGSYVADRLRHSATFEPPAAGSPIVSRPVAGNLRHENPQNCSGAEPMSQMSQMSQGATSEAWNDVEEERAAIVEHDGKIPRAWAEGFARLDPDRPPGDVPLRRWQRLVDDVGLFLDRWAAYAAALGWGSHDLFGCDRDRPFARIDQCGLLWLLNGDRLIMLTENAATIEMRTGARLTYRRKPAEPGRVLAWELAQ